MSMFPAMTWKSYALVSGAGVLSMWVVAAPPSRMPGGVTPAQPREAAGAAAAPSDIEEQANRLQARLQQEALYREPGRNLFRFAPRPAARPSAPGSTEAAVPAVPELATAPPPLPMRLAGVAIDQDGDATVRTAILSTFSGVVLARPGDEVLDRFRVTAVQEEAVDLVTIADGTPVRLTLKNPNSH
jgi:hypothetical protein